MNFTVRKKKFWQTAFRMRKKFLHNETELQRYQSDIKLHNENEKGY